MAVPYHRWERTYTFSQEDVKTLYADCCVSLLASNEFYSLRYYACLIGMAFLCQGIAQAIWHNPVLSGSVFIGSTIPLTLCYVVLWREAKLRRLRCYMGDTRLRLREEGVVYSISRGIGFIPWTNVKDIAVGNHHLVITFWLQGSPRIFPLPRHTFADEAEIKAFVACATEHWLAAIRKQPLVPMRKPSSS